MGRGGVRGTKFGLFGTPQRRRSGHRYIHYSSSRLWPLFSNKEVQSGGVR